MTQSFICRWWKPMGSLYSFWTEEKKGYGNAARGLLNISARFVLALCTLVSIHHTLQSIFYKWRFAITDAYCFTWFVFTISISICATYSNEAWLHSLPMPSLIVITYRLAEILSRELWVILYRDEKFTSVSRVLVLALINYATVTGLFGHLYQRGSHGYFDAATVSLTFSLPTNQMHEALAIAQSGYCFIFAIIVIAIFVGQVQVKH